MNARYVGLCLPLLLALLMGSAAAHGAALDAESRVVAVTVYQGQALVTREVVLPEQKGLLELVVGDLPAQIVPGSLYAEPGGGVEVRSIRFRQRPVEADTREEVKELDKQIQELGDELSAIDKRLELLGARSAYLDSLEGFTSGTASSELEHGVLNAETLERLTEMIFERRAQVAEQQLELGREQRELHERVGLLRRQRETITGKASRTLREAVVFLDAPAGGGRALRLTYLVSGASWTPSYNLRANEDRTRLVVEYNASVQQMSGEDWSDVAMTLSTATPSLVASAPKLETLKIRLAARTQTIDGAKSEELFQRQKILAFNRGNVAFEAFNPEAAPPASVTDQGAFGGGGRGGFGAAYQQIANAAAVDRDLNGVADEIQLYHLTCPTSSIRESRSEPSRSTEGLSVVYRLANKTSLPSRSDRQLIQIASMPIDAEFYRVASPSLTSYVYEEARLMGGADLVLLAGPAATFLGDRFVGRGEVPSVSIGESFTIGLGIDESLRASRVLLDKRESVQGGNKVSAFDYKLTIENFGDEPVAVRLFDRLPDSQGSDIKVQLVESNPQPTETDEDHGEGVLRWDLEVAADATGAQGAEVSYTMQIEHDKNLTIVGMPANP